MRLPGFLNGGAGLLSSDHREMIHWVVESASDAMVILTPSGQLVTWNGEFERLVRYPFQELKTVPLKKIFPNAEAILNGTRPEPRSPIPLIGHRKIKLCARTKAGDEIMVEVIISGFRSGSESFILAAVQREDLKRNIEDSLRLSEIKFRTLAETIHAGIFIYQGDHFRYVNPYAATITGYPRDELLAIDFWHFVHPDQREFVRQRGMARQRGEMVPQRYELKILTKAGEIRWLDFSAGTIEIEGKLAGLGIAYDITEKKKSDLKEQAARTFAESIVENVNQPLLVLDDRLRIVRANRCFRELFQYEPLELQGALFPNIRNREWNIPALIDRLKNSLFSHQGFEKLEFTNHFERLGERTFVLSAQVLDPALHPSAHILFAMEDVTERRRVRLALQNAKEASDLANQAKSTFLANMSHEIRTPLTAIIAYAEMLAAKGSINQDLNHDHNQGQGIVERIRTNAQHLKELVDDVLDLSKIEANRMDVAFQEFALKTKLKETFDVIKDQAQRKGLEFTAEIDEAIPEWIQTDPTRVRQVLINILGNAVKFTKQGRIQVKVQLVDEMIRISIQDTGCGITESESKILFAPFVQADNSSTRGFEGTGLGLALSRRLARLLGGDLLLVESRPGQGSTFVFTFRPLKARGSGAKTQPKSVATPGPALEGMKVLVVEDNDTIRQLLCAVLDSLGIVAEIAVNGRIGVEKAMSQSHDLILMDLQMPELNGFDATSQLREKGYTKPIVALSARQLSSERARCVEAGFADWIAKPFSIQELAEVLNKYAPKSA